MPRDIPLALLDRVRIASPCPMRWDDMVGDDKVRHCAQCNLNVHNLSAMTRDEAEALLAGRREGERLCGTFYQRPDGTVLTRDCPVGLAAVREKARRAAFRIAAALGLVSATGIAAAAIGAENSRRGLGGLASLEPFRTIVAWIAPAVPVPMPMPLGGAMVAGDICAPPPPAPAPPPPAPTSPGPSSAAPSSPTPNGAAPSDPALDTGC